MEIATFIVVLLLLLTFCAREFLSSYYSKKGENLATKEDIAEITREIESVRANYTQNLEKVRADLSSSIQRYGFRYGQEFEILKLLMKCLVELRDAALGLNPEVDFLPENANHTEIKEQRLDRFHQAHRRLYLAREEHRPFYADTIFQRIYALEGKCFSRAVHYYEGPGDGPGLLDFGAYWSTVESNRKDIAHLSSEAMEEIRKRVESWGLVNRTIHNKLLKFVPRFALHRTRLTPRHLA